jgi:hypothetical protein
VTPFGAGAVTALSSACAFAIGSILFGSVEAPWSIIALRRFAAFRSDIPGQRLTLK